ncbi:zinc finger transcription factor YY1-like [Curcuma longa]|uniref:zinc finger transcription factor YY1-like n=1 Tax=Curcuma longa TaxID=136217 RepID=UPI003D9EC535
MDFALNHPAAGRRLDHRRCRPASVRWFKEWVPQDLVATGGKCYLFKWVTEDILKALNEKSREIEEQKPEPATEVLFLCSYEGCGKTFMDAGTLRKHAHVHGEKQHICQYEGRGKKFLDSSKLKRHYLIHTGERDLICPHEGCGKYDMNETPKHTRSVEKLLATSKATASGYGSTPASVLRPFACPYEACDKAYIHEYKLNLHFKREHPGHNSEEHSKVAPAAEHAMDELSDRETHLARGGLGKTTKRSKPNPTSQLPPTKHRKVSSFTPTTLPAVKKQRPSKDMHKEDSEETEEDGDNVERAGWKCQDSVGEE